MAELQPIHDRSHEPLRLSESDHLAVEWGRLSYWEAVQENAERVAIENEILRRRHARQARDLSYAEQVLSTLMGVLALATIAAVVWAIVTWR